MKTDTPPIGELFGALENERRRRVLRHLSGHGETSLSDMSREIAFLENDDVETPQDVSSDQRKNTYVALYQCHLPKLSELGLIEYEDRGGEVWEGPHLAEAMKFLAVHDGEATIVPKPDPMIESHRPKKLRDAIAGALSI